jgi:L-alanine-DL-glutamate epimerase-like enolase superfamily enzyme
VKVAGVSVRRERLALTRPYRTAGLTTSAEEIFRVVLSSDTGAVGLGAASPEAVVTGETPEQCAHALEDVVAWLPGADVRRLGAVVREAGRRMRGAPAALAAIDMALHDLFARDLGLPLADVLGRVHESLPTSVTIGIQPMDQALSLADEFVGRGFKALKVKVGESLDHDLELLRRIRERFGRSIRIRADANVGYTPAEAIAFLELAEPIGIEFLEQPVRARNDGLRRLPEAWRDRICADESLVDENDALQLAAETPTRACGVFNVKLMKCGGIRPAMRIAAIAEAAGIRLMWGCMDESVVGIAAALHVALASPATRYLDLDGSFDLARDIARGGFELKDGEMSILDAPGLGAELLEDPPA